MTHLLVISSDSRWSYYIQRELGRLEGIEVAFTDTCATALDQLQSKPAGRFDAILVDGGAPIGRAQEEVEREIDSFIASLRAKKNGENGEASAARRAPVLLWSSYQAEGLSRIASRFESTQLLANDTYEIIGAALAAVTAGSGKKADYARVELEIGSASLCVRVSVDGKGVIAQINRILDWRPRLKDLEEKFKIWGLWQRKEGQATRYTDYWEMTFKEAGQRLAGELDYHELGKAVDECLKHVDEMNKVHFRFSLLASDVDATFPYVNVPFELLYDTHRDNFVRALAPVARRIGLKTFQRTGTPLAGSRSFTGRMLFVKSNAYGLLEIPGTLFGGKSQIDFPQLNLLDAEFKEIAGARVGGITDILDLETGMDCIRALKEALQSAAERAVEIVHFSGHSVQADDGSVYLVLPGGEFGQVRPLLISDFAVWAREAKVQLVLLSSCESSRPDSVFRLAQVGVPAAVGFRWEVEQTEAAYFSVELHRELAKKAPLARAFYSSVSAVKLQFRGSPTFASPMLVIQNEEWTS